MAAATTDRSVGEVRWVRKAFTLTGVKSIKGGAAALVLGTGKVVNATGAANQLVIGTFDQEVDATAADKLVSVTLPSEKVLYRFVNGTSGDACAATNIGQLCYALDNQTASILPAGKSVLGRIWDVSTAGVLVELLESVSSPILIGTAPAFAAGDCAVTAALAQNGTIFDVPTTAANSTITLPVTGVPDGTELTFCADGTKNGHTVQYRFGTTAITTALTASKAHRVVVTKLGSVWMATAYVSP